MTYLDKPWLELVINDDVIPVTLETVLVIVHHRLRERGEREEWNMKVTSDVLGMFSTKQSLIM